MAITIKDRFGNSSTPSVTGTPNLYIKGPPSLSFGNQQGLYICVVGPQGANGTYAWVEDQPITSGTAPPTTYTALGL